MPLVKSPYGVAGWLPLTAMKLPLVRLTSEPAATAEARLKTKGVCGPPLLTISTPSLRETTTSILCVGSNAFGVSVTRPCDPMPMLEAEITFKSNVIALAGAAKLTKSNEVQATKDERAKN